MLHKQRSRKVAILKYGLFIPLFATALIMSSATIRTNEKIQELADQIPLNAPIESVKEVVQESIQPIVPQSLKKKKMIEEQPIGVRAGWEDFYKFLKMNIRYPALAQKNKIHGTAMIRFTVANGQVEDAGIATKLVGGCDAEALRTIILFPGFKTIPDGKYTLRTNFLLTGNHPPVQIEKPLPLKGYTDLNEITITAYGPVATEADNQNGTKIYDFVSIDTQPGFPGGFDNFYSYLKRAIKYPEEAIKNKVQGKVFLSFIVEKNGDLNDIKVERGLGSGTDEEAVRVLKASPKWVPGTQGGNPVRVKYNIPISFNSGNEQISPSNKSGSAPMGNKIGIRFKSDNGGEIKFGENPENEPLYVLDGKPIDGIEMKRLDPNNIESIHVLKDAKATALYGSKGANGVILITSKTGKVIEKVKEEKK